MIVVPNDHDIAKTQELQPMLFPADHTIPEAPAATTEEAEQRLLDLLRKYAEMPRAAKPDSPGMINVLGQMNIWTNILQAGIGIAYMEISGKPVPPEYSVSKDTMSLWGTAQ